MPLYPHRCERCGKEEDVLKPMSKASEEHKCSECETPMRKIIIVPAITGTADSFGIGNAFVDDKTGKTIDNWKSWEKAGYKSALNCVSSDIKNEVKRKVDKCTKHDTGKRFSVAT